MRRVSLRKPLPLSSTAELVPIVKEILAEPVRGEPDLLAAVRKSERGDCEGCVTAAAVAARALVELREGFGGSLPAAVRKEIGELLDEEQADSVSAAERTAELNDDDSTEEDEKLDHEQRISRGVAQRNAERMSKADLASLRDAYDAVALDWAADRIQKAEPTLTRPAAIVKALDNDPSLADRARRAQKAELRAEEAALESPERARLERRVRVERQLQAKADAIFKAAGGELTEAQAFVRAITENRDLARERG
jgi:hypothetical protein